MTYQKFNDSADYKPRLLLRAPANTSGTAQCGLEAAEGLRFWRKDVCRLVIYNYEECIHIYNTTKYTIVTTSTARNEILPARL